MKYLLASENVDRAANVRELDCECGESADHLCPFCDRPICHTHSYDVEGAHKANGICSDCAQIAIYEQYMEATYGRADWN